MILKWRTRQKQNDHYYNGVKECVTENSRAITNSDVVMTVNEAYEMQGLIMNRSTEVNGAMEMGVNEAYGLAGGEGGSVDHDESPAVNYEQINNL